MTSYLNILFENFHRNTLNDGREELWLRIETKLVEYMQHIRLHCLNDVCKKQTGPKGMKLIRNA